MIKAIETGKKCMVYEVRRATVANGYVGCRRVIGSAARAECPPPQGKKIKKK